VAGDWEARGDVVRIRCRSRHEQLGLDHEF
jgi:hypothetical protein